METKKNMAERTSLDEILDFITPEFQERIDYKMNLAVKIKAGMDNKGWNNSDFAKEMGVKNSQVTRWLSGTQNFESDTLFAIGKKLGICILDVNVKDGATILSADSTASITLNVFVDLKSENNEYRELLVKSGAVQMITTSEIGSN